MKLRIHVLIFIIFSIAIFLVSCNQRNNMSTESEIESLSNNEPYSEEITSIRHEDTISDFSYVSLSENDTSLSAEISETFEQDPTITIAPTPTSKPKPSATHSPSPSAVPTAKIEKYSLGNTLIFGTYEQDNNIENGKEKILWRIINVEEDRVLLLSEKVLDAHAYGPPGPLAECIVWEDSIIREWLNGYFYDTAFTANEKNSIEKTLLENNLHHYWRGRPGGNNTLDNVFILCVEQAIAYLNHETNRQFLSEATKFALNKEVYNADNKYAAWWLRSPGFAIDNYYATVTPDGEFITDGVPGHDNQMGVRPAIWLKKSD